MPKIVLLTLSLVVIILTAFFTLLFNANSSDKSVSKSEIDTAVNQAQYIYRQKKLMGEDFSNGPCLSNDLLPGWVIDIVHSPRVEIDDLSQNQCPAFLEGRAKHFVELDLDGNLVGVQ